MQDEMQTILASNDKEAAIAFIEKYKVQMSLTREEADALIEVVEEQVEEAVEGGDDSIEAVEEVIEEVITESVDETEEAPAPDEEPEEEEAPAPAPDEEADEDVPAEPDTDDDDADKKKPQNKLEGETEMIVNDKLTIEDNGVEYNSTIFAKAVLGKEMTESELTVFNQSNTGNNGVVIPTTMNENILALLQGEHPFLADLDTTNISGKLQYIKHSAITSGDASWVAEATATPDEVNAFITIDLDGYELVKSIQVTFKQEAMAIDAFVPFLTREIAQRISDILGNSVLHGAAVANVRPAGIIDALVAGQKAEYAGQISYADVTAQISRVHESMLPGAAFYANNATIWNQLANIVDGEGRPVFIADPEGGRIGRLFGIDVKMESGAAAGELILANASQGATINFNGQASVESDRHPVQRTTDYAASLIVDWGILYDQAFSILSPEED
jgi:HK97 family phage major capsid protein